MNRHWNDTTTTTTAQASGRRPKIGAGPDPDRRGVIGAQALDVIADYDQVRTWSDPSARQRELARIGATAVDLLRRLSAHDSTVEHPKRRVHDPRSGETSRPTHSSGARI